MATINPGIRQMTWADVLAGYGGMGAPVQDIFSQPFGGSGEVGADDYVSPASPSVPADVTGWMGIGGTSMAPTYTAPDIFSSPHLFPGGFGGFSGITPYMMQGLADPTTGTSAMEPVYDPASGDFQNVLTDMYGTQESLIPNALSQGYLGIDAVGDTPAYTPGAMGSTPISDFQPSLSDWDSGVTAEGYTGAEGALDLGKFKVPYAAGEEKLGTADMAALSARTGLGSDDAWADKGFAPSWNISNVLGESPFLGLGGSFADQDYNAAIAAAEAQQGGGGADSVARTWAPQFGTGITEGNLATASPTGGVGLDDYLFTGQEAASATSLGRNKHGGVPSMSAYIDRAAALEGLYGKTEGTTGLVSGLASAGVTAPTDYESPYLDRKTDAEVASAYKIPSQFTRMGGQTMLPMDKLALDARLESNLDPGLYGAWQTAFPGSDFGKSDIVKQEFPSAARSLAAPMMENLGAVAAGEDLPWAAESEAEANTIFGLGTLGDFSDYTSPLDISQIKAGDAPTKLFQRSKFPGQAVTGDLSTGMYDLFKARAEEQGMDEATTYGDLASQEKAAVGLGLSQALKSDIGPTRMKETDIAPRQESAWQDITGAWKGTGYDKGLIPYELGARQTLMDEEAAAIELFNQERASIMGDATLPNTSLGYAPDKQSTAMGDYITERDAYDAARQTKLGTYMGDVVAELGTGGKYETGRKDAVDTYKSAMGLPGSGSTTGYLPAFKDTMADAWSDYIRDRSAAVLGFGEDYATAQTDYQTSRGEEMQDFELKEIEKANQREDRIGQAREEYRDTERDIDREIRSLDREGTAARRAIRGFEGGGLVSGRRGRMGDEEYEQIQQQKQDLLAEKKEAKKDRKGKIAGSRTQYGRDMKEVMQRAYNSLVGPGGFQQVAQDKLAADVAAAELLLSEEGQGAGELYQAEGEAAEKELGEGRKAALDIAEEDERTVQTGVETRLASDLTTAKEGIGALKSAALGRLYAEGGKMPKLATDIEGKVEAVQGEGSSLKTGAKDLLGSVAGVREDYLGKDEAGGVGSKLKSLGASLSDAWEGGSSDQYLKGIRDFYEPNQGQGQYEEVFSQAGLGLGGDSKDSPIFKQLVEPRALYAADTLGRWGQGATGGASNVFTSDSGVAQFAPKWIGAGSGGKADWYSNWSKTPKKFWGQDYYPAQIRPHWGKGDSGKYALGWMNAPKANPKIRNWGGSIGSFLTGIVNETNKEKVIPTYKYGEGSESKEWRDVVGAMSPSSGWTMFGKGDAASGGWGTQDLEWEGLEGNPWK